MLYSIIAVFIGFCHSVEEWNLLLIILTLNGFQRRLKSMMEIKEYFAFTDI